LNRKILIISLSGMLGMLAGGSLVFGQTTDTKAIGAKLGVKVLPVELSPERLQAVRKAVAAGTSVPMWNYNILSPIDSNTYSGDMIGRDPGFNAHGHTTTNVSFYLVPLILKFPSSGPVFDPTTANSCNKDNSGNPQSSLFFVRNSPEFVASPLTINGVNEGTVQYTDAFQKGNFHSIPPGKTLNNLPYHYSFTLTVTAAQTINVPTSWNPGTMANNCGTEGFVAIESLDPYLQNTAIPASGAGTNSVVMFLVDSIYETMGGKPFSAGYHSAFFPGGGTIPQVYGISEWDSAAGTAFVGGNADLDILGHEIGELTDDPLGTNSTPAWGHIGQVTGCQADLEVGDPLTGTLFPGITMSNFTYHPQELTFFDWFFRVTPSRGAGGKYSDNGTFTSDAGAVCM